MVTQLNTGFHIKTMCFSRDGKKIVISGYEGPISIFSLADDRHIHTFELASGVSAVFFSSNGKFLFVDYGGDRDDSVELRTVYGQFVKKSTSRVNLIP